MTRRERLGPERDDDRNDDDGLQSAQGRRHPTVVPMMHSASKGEKKESGAHLGLESLNMDRLLQGELRVNSMKD